MRSVAALRKWVAEQLQQFEGNSDVDYVLHYIRRNTDHPMYTDDPLLKPEWDRFLSGLNCREIRLK